MPKHGSFVFPQVSSASCPMVRQNAQSHSATEQESPMLHRCLLVGGFLAVWMLAVVGRLYYLQIIQYIPLLSRAQKQQQHTVKLAPERGTIFDRQMQPLAMSRAAESIFAAPAEIVDRAMVANLLAEILGVDGEQLLGHLNTHRSFCFVKRKVSDQDAERVRSLNLKGIYLYKEPQRAYPKRVLAAGVLGYVGTDDNGLAGLEYGMDGDVKGSPGLVMLVNDARLRAFRSTERTGLPGKNVVLSLDENIELFAEKALVETVEKWHAAGGVVVVQNPNTGEILAMASAPGFDPSQATQATPPAPLNRAIAWVYEPGSTFKLVTLTAALEEKLTNPDEVVDCQMGSIVLAGHVIHDWKRFGALTVREILIHSSDVGSIKLGLRLGQERLYRYMRAFGFGAQTEIELPGEECGLLKPPSRWSGLSIGEMSIGQEVSVTPIQLVTAYSAIANGGIRFQPRIVREVFRGGVHDPIRPAAGRRVVSERTAQTMREILTLVVEEGTGKLARLNGYSAAGKTGTAQKIDPSGAYSQSHYVSSFVGFAPASHPAISVLVSIDSPVGGHHGGEVAAPVFKSVAEETLAYLSVPQDRPTQPIPGMGVLKRQPLLKTIGLRPEDPEASSSLESDLAGSSVEVSDSGTTSSPHDTVLVERGPMVTMPNFTGLAVRRVAEECQERGLDLSLSGSGLAVEQNPPAGTRLAPGSQIRVRFAR
jgi:cell division protein FtsI (penicillin-binding protein 3)